MERPDYFSIENGQKVKLPFTDNEYQKRIDKIRNVMSDNNIDMTILTSMHNITYYTGFIYCSFGRPYGCVITKNKVTTISANIDAGQPWRRSFSENVIYTDWKRDNFLKAIVSIIGRDEPPKTIGIENDHVTLEIKEKLNLPHKMMHKRNFVLFPLFEIQKNWIHPDKQIDVKTLISLLPDRDIRSIKQI